MLNAVWRFLEYVSGLHNQIFIGFFLNLAIWYNNFKKSSIEESEQNVKLEFKSCTAEENHIRWWSSKYHVIRNYRGASIASIKIYAKTKGIPMILLFSVIHLKIQ